MGLRTEVILWKFDYSTLPRYSMVLGLIDLMKRKHDSKLTDCWYIFLNWGLSVCWAVSHPCLPQRGRGTACGGWGVPLSTINTRWDCDTFRLSNSSLSPLCTRVPYFLDRFYTNKIAIRLFVVCYPTVTRADRVFNEKKGTPHPPLRRSPFPAGEGKDATPLITPTNPNLNDFNLKHPKTKL